MVIKTILNIISKFTGGNKTVADENNNTGNNNTGKKSNPIWWVLGTVVLLVVGYFVWQHILGIRKDLQIEKQNFEYSQDSLRTSQTDMGFLSEKYLKIISDNDALVRAYEEQGNDLVILQNVNLQLIVQLESDTVEVIDTLGGTLTAVFENTQSDSGLILFWKDSVIFKQNLSTLKWSAVNFPEIDVLMWYNMIIYRDEDGLLSGSLETFSPYLKTSLLETKIVDDYVPSFSLAESPSIFAITVGGSYYYANIGLFLRLGKWAINPSYNFALSGIEENISSWYKKLDIKFVYFIW